MDSMYSTPCMYYDNDAHVKGELLVMVGGGCGGVGGWGNGGNGGGGGMGGKPHPKTVTSFSSTNIVGPQRKKRKEVWKKGSIRRKKVESISGAVLTETEQLKIITKRSRKETHSSHASGSGINEGTGFTPGVPMHLIRTSEGRYLLEITMMEDDDVKNMTMMSKAQGCEDERTD
ncbi:hypothetical protein Tco_0469466 [Tanacetum coccineum]